MKHNSETELLGQVVAWCKKVYSSLRAMYESAW